MGFIMTAVHKQITYFDHAQPSIALAHPHSPSPFTALIVRLSLDAKDGTSEGTLTFDSGDHLNCQKSPHTSLG